MTAEDQRNLDTWARIVALEGFDRDDADAIRAWLDDASAPFGGAWIELFDRWIIWNAGDLRPAAASVYRSLARGLSFETGRRAAWILAELDNSAAMLGPCLISGIEERDTVPSKDLAGLEVVVPLDLAPGVTVVELIQVTAEGRVGHEGLDLRVEGLGGKRHGGTVPRGRRRERFRAMDAAPGSETRESIRGDHETFGDQEVADPCRRQPRLSSSMRRSSRRRSRVGR